MGNNQIKLLFPAHGLPFAVPYQREDDLSGKIDKILRDLVPRAQLQQGKWVLLDPENRELLHPSCLRRVKPDRTYLVLDVKDAGEAGQRFKGLVKSEAPPGYDKK